ncbi:GPW/gp25 family protein [Emticicia sp. 17c]|uniref:GPW/gp25 family protein n=1 Tax=Emticicia sp. 17c TaxID=3127704 RepID=UPI00301C0DFD
MNDLDVIIGTGWGFPPTFLKNGDLVMTTGADDINASLHILLSTTIGERIMQPQYGCNLKSFLFDPMNVTMEAYIKKIVGDAIIYFEPRISLEKLTVNFVQPEGRMEILIDYLIDSTNSRANYVYPFYIVEGTEI